MDSNISEDQYNRDRVNSIQLLAEAMRLNRKNIDDVKALSDGLSERIYILERDIAIFKALGDNAPVRVTNEPVVMKENNTTAKDIAQNTGLAAMIGAVIVAVFKGLFELFSALKDGIQ